MRLTVVQRRLLSRTFLLGAFLTLVVIVVEYLGGLAAFERSLYDRRSRDCQFFSPEPSKRIFIVYLDDPTITEVGRWPWPRDKQAVVIDELRLAGAKVIALDIMLTEEEQVRYVKGEDGQAIEVNNDATLAGVFAKAGNVLAPASAGVWAKDAPEISTRIIAMLKKDPEAETDQVIATLAQNEADRAALELAVKQDFLMLLEQAMTERMDALLSEGDLDLESAVAKVTPRAVAAGTVSDARLLAVRAYQRAKAMSRLDRFMWPIPATAPALMRARVPDMLVTVPILVDNAAYSGYVDFPASSDGTVREVPLVANFRDKLFPHMILAMACADLGVPVSSIRLTKDTLTIPVPNQEPITIPINTLPGTEYGSVGAFMSIPWFGTRYWENMYDWPKHANPLQQDSIKNIWRTHALRESIDANWKRAIEPIMYLKVAVLGENEAQTLKALKEMSPEQLKETITALVNDKDFIQPTYDDIKARPVEGRTQSENLLVGSYEALRELPRTNQFLEQRIIDARQELKSKLSGKLVIVGSTALGLYDYYSTSIHPQCPGVVIQGVALNAILTRNFLKTAPSWINIPITALMGAIVTLFVAFLPSYRALLATFLLTFVYFVINGILLFDYGNWIVPAAGALSAAGLVWGILTLYRYIFESAERTRITKRFSSYVDPAIVNFVIEDPDRVQFDGEVREMTVVFTDLAGFTTISEKLQERTVPLLNDYMSRMMPIIRKYKGTWNKFLGDGIMFFYNAPGYDPEHARSAILTVLEMQKAVEVFNEGLFKQQLPKVAMRAGIVTGNMIAGDAGSITASNPEHAASDYTVLGDNVNLSARLESANKALGTRVLCVEKTIEIMGEGILHRPIAKLQVVGKTQGVTTYEPLCLLAEATEKQKRLAAVTKEVVDAFVARDFQKVIDAANRMQDEFGSSKFTGIYLEQAREFLIAPPPDDWEGTIVLESK